MRETVFWSPLLTALPLSSGFRSLWALKTLCWHGSTDLRSSNFIFFQCPLKGYHTGFLHLQTQTHPMI